MELKHLLLLFALLPAKTCLAEFVNSRPTVVDGISYELDEDHNTACVIAPIDFNGKKIEYEGSIVIPETIEDMWTEYVVDSISPNAFKNNVTTSVSIPGTINVIPYFGVCHSLTNVTIHFGVQEIRPRAFHDLQNLESVYFDSTVSALTLGKRGCVIGEGAFRGCKNLKNLHLSFVREIGDWAFYQCGITSLNIPGSLTNIGGVAAFQECSNLTSVIIANGVTNIGQQAFAYCGKLTSVSIPESVTTIGNCAFCNCNSLTSITIPNSVTDIGNGTFQYCSGLTSITLPNNITNTGEATFYHCSNLTTVTIPESVTTIGAGAFYECYSLTSINIPNGVTTIGEDAFCFCIGLTSITIPNSVTNIGSNAFYFCGALSFMEVEEGNTIYDSRNDCNAIIETATNTLIRGCQNTIIPDDVTSICDYAFNGCATLTSIAIPSSVTTIGEDAFYFCGHVLTSIKVDESNVVYDSRNDCNAIIETGTNTLIRGCQNTIIPNDVTSIDAGAFSACVNMTSITIPNSITKIGDYAFEYCYNLKEIYCYAEEVPDINSNAFYNIDCFDANIKSKIVLVVPDNAVERYRAHPVWGQFVIETPTGISEIKNDTLKNIGHTPIFNSSGQRLSKMQKGINIIGSKKVLVK